MTDVSPALIRKRIKLTILGIYILLAIEEKKRDSLAFPDCKFTIGKLY